MDPFVAVQELTTWILPILIAVTMPQAVHGYVALWLGDRTAALQGRLSLNPLNHVDPVGTVIIPALSILMRAPMFGWAKPVPVDFRGVRSPRRVAIIFGLSGPATNLVLATGSLMLALLAIHLPVYLMDFAIHNLVNSFNLNLILVMFNLLPILPLDGGRILAALLPRRLGYQYAETEPYGMLIILGLFVLVPMLLQTAHHPEFSPYLWIVGRPANWLGLHIAALFGMAG